MKVPNQPPADSFHLVTRIELLATDEGGRSRPVTSDYRPNCWFGQLVDGERLYTDVRFFFDEGGEADSDGSLWIPPGGSAKARAFPLFPERVRPIVSVGMTFDMCEGPKIIGCGTIDAIVDYGSEDSV